MAGSSVAKDELGEMLDAWRRVRPQTELGGMAIVARVLRLSYLWDEALQRVNATFGLQRGWLDVLSALRRTGPPHRLSATRLAKSVLLSSGGMTARLDRMEEAGLVRRLPDPDDRRGVLVELTPKGRSTIDKAIDAHARRYEEFLSALSVAERKGLADTLRRQLLSFEHRP